MKKSEFEERMKVFHSGDCIRLTCRGNYGPYVVTGKIVKVENGRVYLTKGYSHSYRRIIGIHVCLEEDEVI